MSLVSRLIGVALSLSGGWLIGSAQGAITVSNNVGNTIFAVAVSMPTTVGTMIGRYIEDLIVEQLAPNYGSFWVFGVILACGGFILVYRGDRKPRPPEEALPLLTEPLYPNKPE